MEENVDKTIEKLYNKLDTATRNKQNKKVVKIAQELLDLKPEADIAKQCKLIALIKSGQLEKAYKFISGKNDGFQGLEKEKAYCLYRNGKLKDALALIDSLGSEDPGVAELRGQLLHRLGKVNESKDVYHKLALDLAKSARKVKVNPDLIGNVIAAHVSAGQASEVESVVKPFGKTILQETPEIAYNNACVSVSLGQYDRAMELLQLAERVGYEALYEEDLTEEEMKMELAHVFTQKGYVAQQLQNKQEAIEIYTDVLKNVSSDDMTLAVAINNLVACRGNAQAFDSMKRFDKLAKRKDQSNSQKLSRRNSLDGGLILAPEFEEQLLDHEKQTLMLNYAIVSLLANRFDAVEHTSKFILRKTPESLDATVLLALSQAKKDQLDEGLRLLDDFGSRYDAHAADVEMAKCELATSCNKWKLGAQALIATPEEIRYQPATVSTIIALLEKCNDQQQVDTLLSDALQWWESNTLEGGNDAESKKYISLLKLAGKWKYQAKQLEEAAKYYEKVLEKTTDPTLRSEAMAGLVQLHGVNDSSVADKYEAEMPPIPGIDELDVELLEQTTVRSSAPPPSRRSEESTKKEVETFVAKSKAQLRREFLKTLPADRQDIVLQRQRDRRRAKRKAKLNITFDPNVEPDPERWIPKRDRTGYKKTRREKQKEKSTIKGSQGAGKVDDRLDKSSAPIEAPSRPNLPPKGRRRGRR